MYSSTGMDSAKVLKPNLLIQLLGETKAPETEVLKNIFKNKKQQKGDTATRRFITRTIKAIPYVDQKSAGVPLTGKSVTDDGIKSDPMRAHHRIQATDFDKIKNLLGQERRAALAEEMAMVKETIAWNMEWYARHFLTTGNCDYPLLIDGNAIADSQVYSLGTMTAADAAPSTLFDAATATVTDVILHLEHMFKKGQDVVNRNHFQSRANTLTYARTNVWNALFNILNSRRTNDVVSSRVIDMETLDFGGWKIKKFDAETKSPVDQSAGYAIPAKRMRMIDVGPSAPHTMVNLEVINLKATAGGQKYVFVYPVEDPYGKYVDIMIEFTPVGLLIPEAMVDSLAVIS